MSIADIPVEKSHAFLLFIVRYHSIFSHREALTFSPYVNSITKQKIRIQTFSTENNNKHSRDECKATFMGMR